MSKDPGWKLSMKIPEDWTQLPTAGKADPAKWAEQTARETLGPDVSTERVAARASNLVRLTQAARARRDWYGLVLYPASAPGVVALLDIKAYLPDRHYRTTTLDVLEEIFGGPSADTVGDFSVTREELPGGESVRVRRTRSEAPDKSGEAVLIEGVTHAIHPPGINGAVEVCMTWTRLHLGDKLAEMADAIAATVHVASS